MIAAWGRTMGMLPPLLDSGQSGRVRGTHHLIPWPRSVRFTHPTHMATAWSGSAGSAEAIGVARGDAVAVGIAAAGLGEDLAGQRLGAGELGQLGELVLGLGRPGALGP